MSAVSERRQRVLAKLQKVQRLNWRLVERLGDLRHILAGPPMTTLTLTKGEQARLVMLVTQAAVQGDLLIDAIRDNDDALDQWLALQEGLDEE